LVAVVAALAPAGAAATPGDLDPTFSGDGKVTFDLGPGGDIAQDAALLPGGAIALAGLQGSSGDMAVLRVRADGTPDPAYGAGGLATADFGPGPPNSLAWGVAVDPQGRVVVAGTTPNPAQYGVARFDLAGLLDNGFAGDGTFTGDFGPPYTLPGPRAVVSYSDGTIGIAGSAGPGDYDFAAARLTEAGAYDASFSGDGRTTVDMGTTFDVGGDATLQPDGKLLIAGVTGAPQYDCGITRLTTAGAPDAGAFGPAGEMFADTGGREFCDGLALDQQGRILLAGRREPEGGGTTTGFWTGRLVSSGSSDPLFGTGGFFLGGQPGGGDATVAVQPDDKVIVAAPTGPPDNDFLVARLNVDGTLDPTFSGDGVTTADFGEDEYPNTVLVLPDGDIVVSGARIPTAGDNDIVMARFDGGPLELDLAAKRKQRVARLSGRLTCSLPCEVTLRAKGRAGGDKFKTKRSTASVPALTPQTVRTKLRKRDRKQLKGERGKGKLIAIATASGYTDSEKLKVKLKP
jgi:uncharacterized delta-60 repeat protein